MLNTDANRCLMVGNDIEMDMAAKNCGISTFYLETESSKSHLTIEKADYRGDFQVLAKILEI